MRQDHVMRCLERPQEEMEGCTDVNSRAAGSADNVYGDSNNQGFQISGNMVSKSTSNGSLNVNASVKKRPITEISEYDIMYIDDKDPDFTSPVPKKRSPKRPKGAGVKTFQGTLSVDKKGKMLVQKPIVETASNIETVVKVAPISKNIDSEISSLRETLGNIDEKIAALERLKEATRRELSKKLKLQAQKTARTTVLDGCERRPLETVMGVVFSAAGHVDNNINTAHNSRGLRDFNSCKYEEELSTTQRCRERAPLWELSKLDSTFDVVVNELETCTKNPVI